MLFHLRACFVVAALAVVTAAAGLFAMPVLDRDEARFVQATTQMFESGDYVSIAFQDQPRHKKPVGIHWMQAASVALLSDPAAREVWAYRIPSVIGAIIAALATYAAGVLLVGRTAAFAGAALLAVCVVVGVEASIAKTDAMVLATAALALWGAAAAWRGHGGWAGILFWAAIGLGVLIKGPITPMVAILGALGAGLAARRLGPLRTLISWRGVLLALLIAAPWFVAVHLATDGAFLRDAILQDMTPKMSGGHEGHGAPPGAHLLLTPILFWPATILLVPGVAMAVGAVFQPQRSAVAGGLAFLLGWLLPTWIVFEALPSKLPHYTSPLYPALALMAGAAFVAFLERRLDPVAKGASVILFALAGALLAGVLVLAPAFFGPAAGPFALTENAVALVIGALSPSQSAILGAVMLAPLVLAIVLWRAPRTLFALTLAAGLGWHWTARSVVAPGLDALFPARAIEAELVPLSLHPRQSDLLGGPLVSTGFTEPSMVFLTASDTVLAEPVPAAHEAGANERRGAIVETRVREAFLAEIDRIGAQVVPVGLVRGFNYSRGEPVELHIYRTAVAADPEALAAAIAAERAARAGEGPPETDREEAAL